MIHITDVVPLEEKRSSPYMLKFQSAEMCYKSDSLIKCVRAKDRDREKQGKNSRLAVVVSQKQKYHGYVGEGFSDLMDTYVAIHNKKSGKMRIIQVEECNMINTCHEKHVKTFDQPESKLTIARKFGGKSAIRAMERIERSGKNMDVMEESIKRAVENYDDERYTEENAFSKIQLEGELVRASLKPPNNPKATTVLEVFRLEDMLSEPVLQSMKVGGLSLLKFDPQTIEMSNQYLTIKMKTALQSKDPDSDENIRILQTSLFMDALFLLLQSKRKLLEDLKLSKYSQELENEVKQHFADARLPRPTKTNYTVHKAMAHYIAMAFMLENGKIKLDKVDLGLRVKKQELLKYANYVGAQYNSSNNTMTLQIRKDAASVKANSTIGSLRPRRSGVRYRS